jgi:hypothetical protein
MRNPDLCYPRDGAGEYVDYTGTVTAVRRLAGDLASVDVHVPEKGGVQGYWQHPSITPMIGGAAGVRVYSAGGGHYPDNRITRCEAQP